MMIWCSRNIYYQRVSIYNLCKQPALLTEGIYSLTFGWDIQKKVPGKKVLTKNRPFFN